MAPSAEGLGHLPLPPLTQLGLRHPGAGFWGVPALGAGPGCGCARLHWRGSAAAPGGPVPAAVVQGAAALPILALPGGAGRTAFAEKLGRKSMNAVQSKQILVQPAPY